MPVTWQKYTTPCHALAAHLGHPRPDDSSDVNKRALLSCYQPGGDRKGQTNRLGDQGADGQQVCDVYTVQVRADVWDTTAMRCSKHDSKQAILSILGGSFPSSDGVVGAFALGEIDIDA
jgi:hypothetical protein